MPNGQLLYDESNNRSYFRIAIENQSLKKAGLQLLFQWSRSVIQDSVRLNVGAKDYEISARVSGPHVFIPADSFAQHDSHANFSLTFEFTGEPLQLVQISWATTPDDLLDPRAELNAWLACRRNCAGQDKAKLFFLDLDQASHPEILTILGRSTEANQFRALMGYLSTRVLRIGREQTYGRVFDPEPLPNGCDSYLINTSRLMQPLLSRFSSLAEAEAAFEAFSSGMLWCQCPPPRGALQALSAGDADSAIIFLLAEYIFAIGQRTGNCWQQLQDFWAPYLNCFVRIQYIFTIRALQCVSPRRFCLIPTPPRISSTEISRVINQARSFVTNSKDPVLLRQKMRGILKKLENNWGHSFFDIPMRVLDV